VGEDIEVRMWELDEVLKGLLGDESKIVLFEVMELKTGRLVVDGGIAGITPRKDDCRGHHLRSAKL
jgi:hypothetical protein